MVGFAQAITFVEDSSEMKTNHLRRSNRCLKLEVRALHVSCSVWDTFEYDGCIHGLLTEEMIETRANVVLEHDPTSPLWPVVVGF